MRAGFYRKGKLNFHQNKGWRAHWQVDHPFLDRPGLGYCISSALHLALQAADNSCCQCVVVDLARRVVVLVSRDA
jgi:hypothetical protein